MKRKVFTHLKEEADSSSNIISLDRYRKRGARRIYWRGRDINFNYNDEKNGPKPAKGQSRGAVLKVDPPPSLPSHHITGTAHLEQLEKRELQKYVDEIQKYRTLPSGPFRFFRKELGVNTDVWPNDNPPHRMRNFTKPPMWSKQREIVEKLVEHRRVAVRSCHTSGKTWLAAGAAIYLAYVWHCLGITTAPTGRQVKLLLWQEIADMWNQANAWRWRAGRPGLGGRLLQTALHLGDKWFVEGFATDSKEFNVPGFHEENVFAIVDEAGGVDPEIFGLLETILSSSNSFVLLIGNPVRRDTEFMRAFNFDSDFYPISISAFDTPNVKHGKVIYPKLVHPDWPAKMKKKFGEDSSFYRSRVMGEFPDEDPDSFVPYYIMEEALKRSLPADEVVAVGADVARLGGDRIVFGERYRSGRYREVENFDKSRLTLSAGKLIGRWNDARSKNPVKKDDDGNTIEVRNTPVINIDDIGVGAGVTDILLEQEYPANGINVAEAPDFGTSADSQGLVKFKNKRAQFYWRLREDFMAGVVDINDEELAQELMAVKFTQSSRGELVVIEKDKIRKELGRSPDKAEAMMLAWAKEGYDDVQEMLQFA